jgi:MFS family permease
MLTRARSLPLLQPLRERDYRFVFVGETVSVVGDQFHFVALAWLILGLTGSGLALGTVLMAAAIPRAVLMLVGGATTDRVAPRAVVLVSNGIRAVVVSAVAILVLGGAVEVWQLVILGVVFGAVEAFFYPALNALLPLLVSSARLPAANGLFEAARQLGSLAGPAIAGVVVAAGGTGVAFAIDALSFVVAFVAIAFVRGGRRRQALTDGAEAGAPGTVEQDAAGPSTAPSLVGSIREGLAYALGDPAIRMLVVLIASFNLAFTGSIAVGLPWLASQRFDGGAAAFGVMAAGFGAGALVGAVLAGSLARPARMGTVALGIAFGMGTALALFGFAPNAAVATLISVAIGLGAGYVNVTVIAWLQARTDPTMLGRVMSLVMLGSVGLGPLSLALAGVLVDISSTLLFVSAGTLVVVASLLGFVGGAARAMNASAGVAVPVPVIAE